jgi:ABC-2 type transport system ATP-binding protein
MQLSITRLSKTYSNGVRALHDVSLTLPNGMFGLLGPNGAGKSSLMRTIATLQEADSGSIRLEEAVGGSGREAVAANRGESEIGAADGGKSGAGGIRSSGPEAGAARGGGLDVLREKTRVRQLLGYLPQEFGVYPKVSAERMLDHIARLKGVEDARERKQLVGGLLENVNLSKDRKKHLGTFSGGMKQRFGIAQALIGNPRLIIVDEPTAGLDPAERNRFYNLLSQLGEHTIVILSTHIVEDVSTLCNNFAIICQGEVLFAGEPEKAVQGLEGTIFTKAIGKDELAVYQQRYRVISTQLKTGRLHIRIVRPGAAGAGRGPLARGGDGGSALAGSDLNASAHEGLLAQGFAVAPPSLEDVYFSHIGTRMTIDTI